MELASENIVSSTDEKLEKAWYVVNTYSGHENKVKENLERRIESMTLQDFVYRVIVAEHEEPVLKDNVPTGKMRMKNLYPGYVFIEMIMSDAAWYMVRNTPGVTGFVGSSGGGAKPFPVPREQIEPVLKRMGIEDPDMYTSYEVGDLVRVLTGPFVGAEGNIVEIIEADSEVSVSTVLFGRPTSITVRFAEVEKI